MNRSKRISGFLSVLALAILTVGCTPLHLANSMQWWHATVTRGLRRSESSRHIDRHCLRHSINDDEAESDAVLLLRIRLGRRMPPYRLLFPVTDGLHLHVGDQVLVQPYSCKIKLPE